MDVVVELSGNEREDDLFNLLHEDDFSIGRVKVDINPIRKKSIGLTLKSDYFFDIIKKEVFLRRTEILGIDLE